MRLFTKLQNLLNVETGNKGQLRRAMTLECFDASSTSEHPAFLSENSCQTNPRVRKNHTIGQPCISRIPHRRPDALMDKRLNYRFVSLSRCSTSRRVENWRVEHGPGVDFGNLAMPYDFDLIAEHF